MKFDDIRPYYEEEIPAAMKRIAASRMFSSLSEFVFPGREVDEVRQMVAGLTSIEEFQDRVMNVFNHEVIRRSITEFTFDGLNRIERGKPYLFVSNHRDIVLDSSLLQTVLHENQFETSEITFGANLMQGELIVDIGKSNKMFRVERGATPKEFYRLSMHLSEYIRHVITEKKSGVWIAQRNGRTKDGNDRTDQGIIKMFSMSGPNDKIETLSELHILPVSVSYEWESCDFLKTFELYNTLKTGKYVKQPGEDVNSILTGILQPKGRVHFEICPPIDPSELMAFSNHTQNEYHAQVAHLIDHRIHEHFRLWPNNYIAHDKLYGQNTYRRLYDESQKAAFDNRIDQLLLQAPQVLGPDFDSDTVLDIFLKIYANPVNNKAYA
ncbi:MAG: 1-acyl-sn-glycerol-3-phosphate acyltransferase [Bacteroidales bacterium]|nr:1-acyl-sn-glycerol-3-phosphate acyltransferase [Bacteroidales bacterium]